jgi:hypothetical protein
MEEGAKEIEEARDVEEVEEAEEGRLGGRAVFQRGLL